MALVVKDRVKETTTTTGTGTLTLAGASAGFQSFSVIGNGNTTYYTITDGTNWEVGIGTYTSSGTTLSRDTILESSNAGSAVNWGAGSKDVFVTYPAERSVYTDGAGTVITPATTSRLGFTNLAQGSALSVLGVTGNATADVASIAAGTDHQVFRRSGTSVAFGAVNLAQSAAITGTLPVGNGGTGATTLTANNVILGNGTSAVQFVAPGTSGNVLTSNGSTWTSAAAPGGGKVLQVLSTLKTDTFTSSTINTWLDVTGLSVSITPSSASSKVLVMYTVAVAGLLATSGTHLQVLRGSTAIGIGTTASGNQINSGNAITNSDNNWSNSVAQTILDSPNTTSSTTYKIQARVGAASSGTLYINRTPNDSNSVFIGRFASSITVMEIA